MYYSQKPQDNASLNSGDPNGVCWSSIANPLPVNKLAARLREVSTSA
jgi:hypothetical protein